MRVSGAKKVHYDSGPNMTPLVDVVMVILIFLMLAGSFGMSEHFMVSKTPIHAEGGGHVNPPPGWTPPVIIEVRVMYDGGFTVAGVLDPGGQRPRMLRDAEELKTTLEAKRAEFGGNTKDVEVRLRPASGTTWENL